MTDTSSLETTPRTVYCGEVNLAHAGREIVLKGWVHRRRDHGRLMFVDLRDRTGLMQVRINPDSLENDRKVGADISIEWTQPAVDLAPALRTPVSGGPFELIAVTQGETNIWPDGGQATPGETGFRARFLLRDREAALDPAGRDALVAKLTEAGFRTGEAHLVSVTHHLREEYVIAVRGTVEKRPESAINPNLPTGETELAARELRILNPCVPLPFRLNEQTRTSEDIRLRHRYLDLRRPELQRNFIMRHKLFQAARNHLSQQGFLEIETPILAKPTPEGARDFLVPSRLNPGDFYALPQSPQLFKQILMISGFDRYFQIARCFRDEDLRANRQPEFTQIDIEMSFAGVDQVLEAMEGLTAAMWRETLAIELPRPFPRMPYEEAMRRFGSDKPDMRFGMELQEITEDIRGKSEFSIFNQNIDAGGAVIAVVHKGGADLYSNTALRLEGDFQKKAARETGARGAAFFRMSAEGDLDSSISKFFPEDIRRALGKRLGMEPGDIVFMLADKKVQRCREMAGRLRLMIARDNDLIDRSRYDFLWVVDFPLFEYNEDEKRWEALHHPFTSPHPEDIDKLESDPGGVRSLAYDLALNGEECAGGSIRIHDSALQQKMLRAIGIGEEEAQAKFGFLLEALRFGAPPHGGIAFGFDRLLMSILNVESIREVIAFPKTQTGTCLMSGAPGEVSAAQLKEVQMRSIAKKVNPAAAG